MPEAMILSDRAGLLVRGVDDGRLLYRADGDGPVPMERAAFRSLLDGLPDARVAEFDDLEAGLAELRRGKEVARCLRLFLIMLDPEEPDEDLEEIADIADARLADAGVRDRVRAAMLVEPLPKEARLPRLKSLAKGRSNLLALTEEVMTLQFSARTVARMLEQMARKRYETLAESEAFLARLRGAGLIQRLTLANDADVTRVAKDAAAASAPGEEAFAIATVIEDAEEFERREAIRRVKQAAAAARQQAARKRMGLTVRSDRGMAQPIAVPLGVTAKMSDERILSVAGPLGRLNLAIADGLELKVSNEGVTVISSDESRRTRAFWGLQRTIVENLMFGVTEGFAKKLLITGVGYRAHAGVRRFKLNVGTSSTSDIDMPEGISIRTPDVTTVEISGTDGERLGRLATEIKRWRTPERYSGKGITYTGGLIHSRMFKGKKPKKA